MYLFRTLSQEEWKMRGKEKRGFDESLSRRLEIATFSQRLTCGQCVRVSEQVSPFVISRETNEQRQFKLTAATIQLMLRAVAQQNITDKFTTAAATTTPTKS